MDIKHKILEYLNKNLVLEKSVIDEIKGSINDLSNNQLNSIYEILEDLDKKQTKILEEKLKETPWFFTELEVDLSREMYNEHIKEELKEKKYIEEKISELFKN